MKKLLLSLAVLFNVALTSSAIAAQDQALIQATRKNQLAHDAQDSQKATPAEPAAGNQIAHDAQESKKAIPPEQSAGTAKKLVLPLDHGPHAVVTPWVNQQRRLRAEEEAKTKLKEGDGQNQGAHSK